MQRSVGVGGGGGVGGRGVGGGMGGYWLCLRGVSKGGIVKVGVGSDAGLRTLELGACVAFGFGGA